MSTSTWNGATADWETPGDWSGGTVPGANSDVIIDSGSVTIAPPDPQIRVKSITLGGYSLTLDDASLATTGDLNNSFYLFVDYYAGSSGSHLKVGGTLTNIGNIYLGNGASAGTKATIGGALNNSGLVVLNDSSLAISGDVNNNGSIYVAGGVMTVGGVLTNSSLLAIGDSLLTATSVTATALDNNGNISLTGGNTTAGLATLEIASAAGFGTAGELTGNVSLSGDALLKFDGGGSIAAIESGASLSLSGAHALVADKGATGSNSALTGLSSNAGSLTLDDGASLTTSGALNNSFYLFVDYDAGSSGSHLKVGGTLTNIGNIYLGNGASAGTKATIGGALNNSGLVVLNDSSLAISGDVNNNGSIYVAGGVMTVGGVLTNSSLLAIGDSLLTATSVTATALDNNGNISLTGGNTTAGLTTLEIASAAGFGTAGELTGNVSLSGDALLKFDGGGSIAAIESGASLSLSGAHALVADKGATGSNSALTGLSSNAGSLTLDDGESLATSGDLNNSFGIYVDYNAGSSGSHLKVGGTLTNIGSIYLGNNTSSGTTVTVGGALNNTSGLLVLDDSSLAISGSLNNSASSAIYVERGSVVTVSGVLTNSGAYFTIGDSLLTAATSVTAAGLTNSGGATLDLTGSASHAATLKISGSASQSGTLDIGPHAVVNLTSPGGVFTQLAGETVVDGTLSAPTIAIAGGTLEVDSGAKLSADDWAVAGAGTSVTLDENLTYAGTLNAGSGATLDLSGGNLTLTGTNDSFAGATTGGSHILYAKGTTSVSGLTIGGTTTFDNIGALTQSGGDVTLGDAAGDVARLLNASTGAWEITDDSGIGLGSSHVLSITNSGLFEKTGGTGTSTIAPKFLNNGQVAVTSGKLDFERAATGTGTDTISPGATLKFDSSVGSATAAAVQTIDFTPSAGGVLDLIDPKGFYGQIADFEKTLATDTVELKGDWVFSSFSENSAATLGTLTLANGATLHAFNFVGDFATSDFTIASGKTTTIMHS